MKKIFNNINLTWYNGIMLFLCAFLMFAGMIMYSDMKITTEGSFVILQGHFFDFYDYAINNKLSPDLVYYPTMYFIFAVWNIPIALIFGTHPELYSFKEIVIMLFWGKTLVLIFCISTCVVLYKICQIIFSDRQISLYIVFSFIFTGYVFIAELAFGTYDYIYMLLVLLGIYIFLKQDKNWWWKFSLIFGISFTIKQLTLFIWLPLLVYREKRIIKLFMNCLIACPLYIFETILYRHNEYFINQVLNSHFILFMTKMTLDNGMGKISLWAIAFSIIVSFSYCKKYDYNKKLNTIWISMLGPISIIFFCHWTINWILLYAPFLTILLFASSDRDKLQFLYFCLGILFIFMLFYQQNNYWGWCYYGEGMLDYSIFCHIRDDNDILITTKLISSDIYTIVLGVIYGILGYLTYMLCPFIERNSFSNTNIEKKDTNTISIMFIVTTIVYTLPIFLGTING